MAQGNCAHESPATFFPSDGVRTEIARRICADCPVKSVCLEWALRHGLGEGVSDLATALEDPPPFPGTGATPATIRR